MADAPGAGRRLHHELLNPSPVKRVVAAHVRGWDKTSDHAPVWVELADKPVRRRHGAGSAPIKA